MHAITATEARANRRPIDVHGQQYFLSGYIGMQPERGTYVEGNEENDNGMPQGFLVEQPPHSVTPPHFHEVNQFQVFVGGGGKIGKHDAAPVSLHYANGHTPYGPIAAGEAGVQYFTLRSAWDPGAKYMPQNRDKLNAGPRRFRLATPFSLASTSELSARDAVALETIIDVEEDGLQAHLLRLGPRETYQAMNPASGGGQYHMVLNGVMAHAAADLDRLSCIFMTAMDAPLDVVAGPDGLELLMMQFPRSAA